MGLASNRYIYFSLQVVPFHNCGDCSDLYLRPSAPHRSRYIPPNFGSAADEALSRWALPIGAMGTGGEKSMYEAVETYKPSDWTRENKTKP